MGRNAELQHVMSLADDEPISGIPRAEKTESSPTSYIDGDDVFDPTKE